MSRLNNWFKYRKLHGADPFLHGGQIFFEWSRGSWHVWTIQHFLRRYGGIVTWWTRCARPRLLGADLKPNRVQIDFHTMMTSIIRLPKHKKILGWQQIKSNYWKPHQVSMGVCWTSKISFDIGEGRGNLPPVVTGVEVRLRKLAAIPDWLGFIYQ